MTDPWSLYCEQRMRTGDLVTRALVVLFLAVAIGAVIASTWRMMWF